MAIAHSRSNDVQAVPVKVIGDLPYHIWQPGLAGGHRTTRRPGNSTMYNINIITDFYQLLPTRYFWFHCFLHFNASEAVTKDHLSRERPYLTANDVVFPESHRFYRGTNCAIWCLEMKTYFDFKKTYFDFKMLHDGWRTTAINGNINNLSFKL